MASKYYYKVIKYGPRCVYGLRHANVKYMELSISQISVAKAFLIIEKSLCLKQTDRVVSLEVLESIAVVNTSLDFWSPVLEIIKKQRRIGHFARAGLSHESGKVLERTIA